MEFNFDNFKGLYQVMHCKTEEEAKEFCYLMTSNGRKWASGESYAENNRWGNHKRETCYNFNEGSYSDKLWYDEYGFTILEWSDFKSPNTQKGNEKMNEVSKNTKEEIKFGVPKIVNVIFNNPATIVEWGDGTKTVVKIHNEEFDEEKGLSMAITKKALGNKRNYYDYFSRWIKKGKSFHNYR